MRKSEPIFAPAESRYCEQMTEREKMLAGSALRCWRPGAGWRCASAPRLSCVAYNASTEEQPDERERLIRELFGRRWAARPEIEPPFYCDYGVHIFAGDRLYMNFGCVVLDSQRGGTWATTCFLAPRVQIVTATHPIVAAERIAGPELGYPCVRIGNNVWIGAGAIICPGVTIGDATPHRGGAAWWSRTSRARCWRPATLAVCCARLDT